MAARVQVSMPPSEWSLAGPSKGDDAPSDSGADACEGVALLHEYCAADEAAGAPLRAVVTYYTETFRRMVKLVRPTDAVLEIGSSWGECTALLGEALSPPRVVGVDTSKEALEKSSAKFPHLTFERADALANPLMVIEIAKALLARCGAGARLVVFADIGGNRELEALVALLPWVAATLAPRLIVVKSEKLHSAVAANGGVFDWPELQARCAKTRSFGRQKLPHPLKAPLRHARDGTPICRFHNYRVRKDGQVGSTCRQGDRCPYNHVQCHRCLEDGHTALECTLEDATPL